MDKLLLKQCISLAFALTYQAHVTMLGGHPFIGVNGVYDHYRLFQCLPCPGAEEDATAASIFVDADDAAVGRFFPLLYENQVGQDGIIDMDALPAFIAIGADLAAVEKDPAGIPLRK